MKGREWLPMHRPRYMQAPSMHCKAMYFTTTWQLRLALSRIAQNRHEVKVKMKMKVKVGLESPWGQVTMRGGVSWQGLWGEGTCVRRLWRCFRGSEMQVGPPVHPEWMMVWMIISGSRVGWDRGQGHGQEVWGKSARRRRCFSGVVVRF